MCSLATSGYLVPSLSWVFACWVCSAGFINCNWISAHLYNLVGGVGAAVGKLILLPLWIHAYISRQPLESSPHYRNSLVWHPLFTSGLSQQSWLYVHFTRYPSSVDWGCIMQDVTITAAMTHFLVCWTPTSLLRNWPKPVSVKDVLAFPRLRMSWRRS